MNDDFEIDELASAYLDDAVTVEERARVDADPALRARVDDLRRVRDALAAPVVEPPAAPTRDSAIASAIAISRVVDLGAERAQRARRRLRIASIAAAAVLLIGAAGLLLRSAVHESSTKFSTVAAAPPPSALASSSQSEFAVIGGPGAYASREALVESIQATLRSAPSKTSAGATSDNAAAPTAAQSTATRCTTTPDSTASLTYTENATLEGAPVQIDVYALTDGSRRIVVTSAGACTLVFTQPL